MITKTFLFLDGIGAAKERSLWQQQVLSWTDFLAATSVKGISAKRKGHCDRQLLEAQHALRENDLTYFRKRLRPSEQFRLYAHCRHPLFLDIETTGRDTITVVGLSDGEHYLALLKGMNLHKEAIIHAIEQCDVLITFNGLSFDLPILRQYFGRLPERIHIDLRHVAARLSLHGGLKQLEKRMGISRPEDVRAMHGQDAALYWQLFRITGNREYVKKLVDYNREDVMNLKKIADVLISSLCQRMLSRQCATPQCLTALS